MEKVVFIQKYIGKSHPKRNYYDCNGGNDNNYLNYIEKGTSKDNSYLEYMGNELKSSGLFSSNGMLTSDEIKKIKNMLKSTGSVIWDCVISFESDYGKKHLYNTEQAIELLNNVFPKYLKEANFKVDNIIWVAGLHENTDNRHIHITFFEKEPRYIYANKKKRYRYGKTNKTKFDYLRFLVDGYFDSSNESIKQGRKIALEKARINLAKTDNIELEKLLSEYFKTLIEEIPKEGRVSYDSKNMSKLRPIVDKAVELVINSKKLKPHFEVLENAILEVDERIIDKCEHYKMDPYGYLYSPKFNRDVRRRMGNILIKEIVKRRKEVYKEYAHIRNEHLRRKNELRKTKYLIGQSLIIMDEMINGVDIEFLEFQERIKKAELERLIEEGIIDREDLEAKM